MPNWKLNLFFNYTPPSSGAVGQGWSETYYRTDSLVSTAKSAFDSLILKRAKLLAEPNFIIAARISDDAVRRDSLLYEPTGYSRFDPQWTTDTPWNAQLIRCASGMAYWRQLYLRGCPDVIFNPQSAAEAGAAANWDLFAADFYNALATQGWCLKVIDKAGPNPEQQVTTVSDLGNGLTRFGYVPAQVYAVGDRVKVYNLRGAPPVPISKVQATTVLNTFDIVYDLPAAFIYAGTATVRKISYTYPAIDTVSRERTTHRIVGRPFGQRRGRRPTTAR